MELVDKAEPAVAQAAERPLRQSGKILPHEHHLPGVRVIQATKDIEQRGLARPGSPDNCYLLARHQLEVHVLEHAHRTIAVLVRLADTVATQHDITHSAAPPPALYALPARPDTRSP